MWYVTLLANISQQINNKTFWEFLRKFDVPDEST